jgi:hypothetical protein
VEKAFGDKVMAVSKRLVKRKEELAQKIKSGKMEWFIYIPEEGDWPIKYNGTDKDKAKATYLKWAKRKSLPKGSRIWSRNKIETAAAKQPNSSVTQAEVTRVIKATAAKFKITVKKLTIHKTHGDSGFGVADLLFQSDNHAHYNATRAMERDVRKALNLDAHFVRAEYYPSDDDDIPKGHAMIQFDLLPLK